MQLPTLDEFLASAMKRGAWPAHGYVKEAGFKSLYVRYTVHYIGRRRVKMLDLANANASHPGKGAFTTLMRKLARQYPSTHLYAECVLTERFAATLVKRYGFKPMANDMCSYYLLR